MIYKRMGFSNSPTNLTMSKTVEKVLASPYNNDYILENAFFIVRFETTKETFKSDIIDLAYRYLWEQTYLRRKDINSITTINPINDDEMFGKYIIDLKLSVAEALDFIYHITPPIFLEKTKDSIKTINDVSSMVNFYLSDTKASDYKYKMEIFRSNIGMYPFQTKWEYPNKRFDLISINYKRAPSITTDGVIDISDQPISYYKGRINADDDWFIKGYDLQLSVRFRFEPTDDYLTACDIASFLIPDNRILNVYYDKENEKVYMSIYTSCLTKNICNKIEGWYYKYK